MNIKFFFMGDEIQGAHSMREDGDDLVVFASGNFPGCSERTIIFPKNEVEIEERDKAIFIDWK